MQLERIQHLLAGLFVGATPLTERDDLRDAIAEVVSGNDRLTPQQQAEIYREQFWLRHFDVLREDFPTLRWLLGDDAFDAFARAYLAACPPDSYTLRDLGNRLADFAARYDGFDAALAPIARDVACFELAFVDVFDGPSETPIAIADVQALAPEQWPRARLDLSSLLRLLHLDHPVNRLRTLVKRADKDGVAARDMGAPPALPREPGWVALWRGRDLKVSYRPIAAPEAALMERLRQGLPLGEAIEHTLLSLDEADTHTLGANLQKWFQGWAMRGWITAVRVD
jgi:hypothetical protein